MLDEFKSFASHLALKSAEMVCRYFREPVSVETKPDESPVTIADRRAEEVMRKLIMKEYPEHGIMGEEFGNHNPEAEYVWVLDPIDGTLNFICGGLMFGTLIALTKSGRPILGVIHQPILKELLIGTNSQTTLNGKPVSVRPCATVSDAVLLTTDPYLIEAHQNMAAFNKLKDAVRVYRCWGDCYGYLLLAAGFVDVMIDPIMHPWDALPLIPIIKGAGGTITDYHGDNPVQGSSIVATGGAIHDAILRILNP